MNRKPKRYTVIKSGEGWIAADLADGSLVEPKYFRWRDAYRRAKYLNAQEPTA